MRKNASVHECYEDRRIPIREVVDHIDWIFRVKQQFMAFSSWYCTYSHFIVCCNDAQDQRLRVRFSYFQEILKTICLQP